MPEPRIGQLFIEFLEKPDQNFERKLNNLLLNPALLKIFNCQADRFENFFKKKYFSVSDKERAWLLYQGIMLNAPARLSEFASLRDIYEKNLVIGKFDICHSVLAECSVKFGESFWLYRSYVLLFSEERKSDELDNYVDEIKRRISHPFVLFIFDQIKVITHSEVATEFKGILAQIAEFQEAKRITEAGLLTQLFVPDPIAGLGRPDDVFIDLQIFPLIDQYQLILRNLIGVVADSVNGSTKKITSELQFIHKLSEKINDPVLLRLIKINNNFCDENLDDDENSMLALYNVDSHLPLSLGYRQALTKLEDPLALINIIAKSRAINDVSRHRDISDDASGSLGTLIKNLADLYKLSPDQSRIEAFLLSRSVKLNHLLVNAQVQFSSYLAMPHRYSASSLRRAAVIAAISCAKITPRTAAYCAQSNSFGSRYVDNKYINFSPHRKLKREICKAVKELESSDSIANLFDRLKGLCPLTKDYLELYSEYCLYAKKYELLIEKAAEALTENAESHICFPMHILIERIEKLSHSSLEATIVAFFYHRHITTHRDHVLNETFERYLLENKVNVPSELLSQKSELTKLETYFFRDVCNVEVLDFLSVFSNAKELRAERVKILDLLTNLQAMSPSLRIKEVEEMATRSLIDARTLEFTRWKISVNDASIKRKHLDRVASLIAYYRDAPDRPIETLHVSEAGAGESSIVNYVVGDKAGTVLKIYELIRTSFLFDEDDGLDKTLSTEIRHGFFSNLIRARLEDQHLITEKNDKGIYKDNEIWRGKNQLASSYVWSKIDSNLKAFSQELNSLLSEAEEWMNVATTVEQKKRIFQYPILGEHLMRVKSLADNRKDAASIIDSVLSMLWETTELNLKSMREKLDGEFRKRTESILKSLNDKITRDKGSAALYELLRSIAKVRGQINDDISKVSEWFNRSPDTSKTPAPFGHVLRIALNSFDELKRPHSKPDLIVDSLLDDLHVPGSAVKPLNIAIINLLDNCYRHSKLGLDTLVLIHARRSDDCAVLRISNNMSEARRKEMSVDVLQKLKRNINNPTGQFARLEGGSGLFKVRQELGALAGATIDIGYGNEMFWAEIRYGNKHSCG